MAKPKVSAICSQCHLGCEATIDETQQPILICENCQKENAAARSEAARQMGRAKSPRKTNTSRANGKHGGRKKGQKDSKQRVRRSCSNCRETPESCLQWAIGNRCPMWTARTVVDEQQSAAQESAELAQVWQGG